MVTELKCNVKLSAEDTSLCSVVHKPNECVAVLKYDLDIMKRWAHDWRVSFNPDPAKRAVEVIFSKKIPVDHPPILLHDIPVVKVDEHKHLGVVPGSRLTFSSYIQSATNKARRGIDMLRFLSNYLSRQTLNELYKLYVRPHLDYEYTESEKFQS